MALPQTQVKTFEEGMAAIRQMAETAQDDFRVKVLKRTGPSPSAPTEMIATFAAARAEHFAMPEAWLTMLAGGGAYVLVALHESEPNTPVAVLSLTPINGPARAVDPSAITKPSWQGPGTQLFPPVPVPSQNMGAPPSVRTLFGQPEAAGAVEDAGARASVPSAPAALGASLDRYVEQRFSLFEAQRRADNEQIMKMIEAQTKAGERQIASLVEVMRENARRPTVEQKPLVEQIVPLIAALAPVIAPILAANKEAAMEARRLAAAEAERREKAEAEARKTERDMLMAMNERASSAAADTMKVVQPMVEAVSTMGRTVLQQVATMQEMTTQPPAEEGLGGLFREGARALSEVMAVKRLEMEQAAAAGNGQRALPAHAQPQPQAQPEPDEPMTPADVAQMPPQDLVREIVGALKAKHAAGEVADGYMMALSNTGFAQMVEQAGGPLKLFGPHLSDVLTTPGFADYIRNVVNEIQTRGATV